MTSKDEFVRMLDEKVASGEWTPNEKHQALVQRAHYEVHREEIKKHHPDEVVAFSVGQMFTGATIHEVLDKAIAAHPGKVAYFEESGRR